MIDNGYGIEERNQAKMFKIFGTVRYEKEGINPKGIGLGLCISKHIVEKFRGQISFISEWKKGTTFFFTFELFKFDREAYLHEKMIEKQEV